MLYCTVLYGTVNLTQGYSTQGGHGTAFLISFRFVFVSLSPLSPSLSPSFPCAENIVMRTWGALAGSGNCLGLVQQAQDHKLRVTKLEYKVHLRRNSAFLSEGNFLFHACLSYIEGTRSTEQRLYCTSPVQRSPYCTVQYPDLPQMRTVL